eukprot:Nitzschia sp. Nitz4//scaffold10_size219509//18466//19429//NITZ4_001395-RA/size219509-augustus-gene-0.212-mRNA-1//1//CDS//3329532821//4693//frame0
MTKEYLVEALGKLLGFDDGASDVLEHLLTIESSEDLVDYLGQLFGGSTSEMLRFVEDVGKFKRGESLAVAPEPLAEIAKSPPSNNPGIPYETISTQPTQGRRNEKQARSRVPPPKKKQAPVASSISSNIQVAKPKVPPSQTSSTTKSDPIEPSEQKTKKALVIRKGTPKRVCGCFGGLHKALTNCLHCGRISCEKEGYDFCPFCNILVEESEPEGYVDFVYEEAVRHKDKLLEYQGDKKFQTTVIDDQAEHQGPR